MSEKIEELKKKYYEIIQIPDSLKMAKELNEFITTNFNFASKHSQWILTMSQSIINNNDPSDLHPMIYGMLNNAFDQLFEEYKMKEN